ncbi:DEAD/DEAH box helicase family protein [Arsukibacterium ikkense]|uniref:DEAD/DEAH box helicase family protein n=1 Tax=Arsukibacterium ikkense TaxID=336831 RepID=UPI000A070A64|nr:DEAD/DEAH box helicase family protein [Arsukibacterium ikkense]
MTQKELAKSELDFLHPVYFPNELDIVSEVFIPVARHSNHFECLSGYFSSNVISELAEPLAYFFQNPQAKGKFLISPNLNDVDREALLEAYSDDKSILNFLMDKQDVTRDRIIGATLNVLKFLIVSRRLDIRVVLMVEGMMHAKIWLFHTQVGCVAIHGSGNATKSGLMTNFEQLIFTREWESKSSKTIIQSFISRFNSFWDGKRADSYTLKLNDKTISEILSTTTSSNSSDEFSQNLKRLQKYMEERKTTKKLRVPEWLNFRDGDFRHQGEAVDAWIANEYRGTLEIATGGGKTLTSLVCAAISLDAEDSAIIIIAVPNKPLIKQWCEDVRKFSLDPVDTEGFGTENIVKSIRKVIHEHKVLPKHTVFVITHDALKTVEVKNVLYKYSSKIMLIGDEAHNLGAASFVNDPPTFISHRLALSATPERQYDEEGTKKLLEYFGCVVYEFPLEKAIGNCLVPFKYFAHKVFLNSEEAELWIEYTEKINNLLWSDDAETKKIVEQLQIRRRAITESAVAKLTVFEKVVSELKDRVHSLAFCTDKNPEQLIRVNNILREQNYLFHQITGVESSDKNLMKDVIESYKLGEIEILTSKRVLDEGFNIPPIKTAFFLASSGTTRTWVQRLGRVLRKSESTGKTHAVIHDFVVFPPSNTREFNALVNGELTRMQWFMSLSLKDSSLNSAIQMSNELLSIKAAL